MRSESAIRSNLRRQGYSLCKSRARNPDTLGYGGYMIVDDASNFAMLGQLPWVYSATLEEVDEWCRE